MHRIIIEFEVKDNKINITINFENNPTVRDTLHALDGLLQMFKENVLKKADSLRIADEDFEDFTKKIRVSDLA